MRYGILLFLVLVSGYVMAAPGTYDVTPTFNQPANGVPLGYRMYEGCDVGLQTKGTLLGDVTSGQVLSFPGDSDSPPATCVVAYNAAGEGPFDVVLTPTPVLQPPGPVQGFTQSCTFQESTPSGDIYVCTVVTN